MKKLTTKIISLALSFLMLTSMIPATAYAEYIVDGRLCWICGEWDEADNVCENCNVHMNDICEEWTHCVECGNCFAEHMGFCEYCGYCDDCMDRSMEHCSLCEEHTGEICEECLLCADCEYQMGYTCENCGDCLAANGECTSHPCEEGSSNHCAACQADYKCSNCGECFYYDETDYCDECGLCLECGVELGEHCSECYYEHVADDECGLCADCALEMLEHCPECGLCGQELCEDGGYHCTICCESNGWICEECGICTEGAGMDLCPDCGLCEDCCEQAAEAEGCSCGNYCVESGDWDSHFCSQCNTCFDEADECEYCGLCKYCCEDEGCPDCGMCVENPDYQSHFCPGCAECMESKGRCNDCEFCKECSDERSDCSAGICVNNSEYSKHFCDICKTCFHDVVQCSECAATGKYICLECCENADHTNALGAVYSLILRQPKDFPCLVSDVNTDYENNNRATFTVKVLDPSKCTFKWQRLEDGYWCDIGEDDHAWGVNTDTLIATIPTTACSDTNDWCKFRCFIDDGTHQSQTVVVSIVADHDYKWSDNGGDTHVLVCVGCGGLNTEAVEEPHTYTSWVVYRAATAEKAGRAYRICTKCSFEDSKSIPKLHTHVWSSQLSHDESRHYYSCTADGCVAQTGIQAHTYGALVTKVAATETSAGTAERTCSNCGYVQDVTLAKLQHVHEKVNADQFDFSKYKTYDASRHWRICTLMVDGKMCKAKYGYGLHVFSAWEISDDRTKMTRTCATCLYSEEKVFTGQDASDAQNSSMRFVAVANGSPSYCFVSPGTKITVTKNTFDPEGHIFSNWFYDMSWDFANGYYIEEGVDADGNNVYLLDANQRTATTFTYTVGDADVRLHAAYEPCTHSRTYTDYANSIVSPTCTTAGKNADVVCRTCHEVVTAGTVKAAYGHNFVVDSSTAKEATCSSYGYTGDIRCNRTTADGVCGKLQARGTRIEKLPHNYGELEVVVAPTCTSAGYNGYVCNDCGHVEKTTKITKTPHTASDWIIDTEATETSLGARHTVCTECSATLSSGAYSLYGTVENPVVRINQSRVTGAIKIAISTTTAGAKICYTADGTKPTSESREYTGPITITKTTTIKAVAVKAGMIDSKVVVAAFRVDKDGSLVCDHGSTTDYEAVPSTCTEKGHDAYSVCDTCGRVVAGSDAELALGAHNYSKYITTPATMSADGKVVQMCKVCDKVKTTTVINKIASVKVSATSFVYDGTAKSASIGIYDSANNKLVKNTDYTLVSPSGRKEVGKYTYKISFIGNYSGSKEVSITITPAQVSSVKTANTSSGIKVSWAAADGATAYYIYRQENGGSFAKLDATKELTYTDTTAVSGNTYAYRIYSYQKVGGVTYKGEKSAESAICYLSTPKISSASATSKGITVKWGAVSGADGYYLYRSDDNGANFSKIKTTSGVSYSDTTANTNGAKYIYRVYAYKTVDGQTYKSQKSSDKATYFLSRPTISSLTSTKATKAVVKWTANSKAKGYEIMYSTKSDFSTDAKTVVVADKATTSKALSGLTSGKKYYAQVRSYYETSSGTKYYSQWSASANVTVK